jgi:hypothetical protein
MGEFGDRSWLEFTQPKRKEVAFSIPPSLYLIGLMMLFLASVSQMEVGSSPLINLRIELGNLAWRRARTKNVRRSPQAEK